MGFAVRVVKLAELLERTRIPRTIIWQLVDAATSVAANHRACRRSRSTRELVSKLAVVDEESDESAFWLELIEAVRSEPDILAEARSIHVEAVALRSIFSSGRATAKRRLDDHGNEARSSRSR